MNRLERIGYILLISSGILFGATVVVRIFFSKDIEVLQLLVAISGILLLSGLQFLQKSLKAN